VPEGLESREAEFEKLRDREVRRWEEIIDGFIRNPFER
jgi:hypothetical protein